jgi:hypothetical protein
MKDRFLPFLMHQKMRFCLYAPYIFVLIFAGSMVIQANTAHATIPKILYYQGKISKTSDGTNIVNGNYSMQFKIYDALSSGTLLWTETWDGGTSQVAFANGMFSAALGTYTNLNTIDFTTGSLYLTVNFNPGAGYDGEMSPRQQLTAAAFAFVANGVSGDGTVNSTVQSATSLTVGRATTNYALQVDTNTASSVTGLKVTAAASGGGIALAAISSGTDENLTLNAKGAGTITIGTAAGSTGDILFGGGSGSTGCTVTNSSGAFACTAGGSFTTLALTGAVTGAASYNGLVVTPNTGVITTGTWNGTTIAVGNGGTGNTSYAATNGVVYYDGTKLTGTAASTGAQCLQTAGSGTAPIWGACGAGGATAFDLIGDPTGNGAIAMGTTTQTFDWTTLSTGVGLTLTSTTGLTTGSVLKVTNNSASSIDNGVVLLSATGNYTGVGGLLNATATTSTAGTLVNFTNNTAGYTGNMLSLSATGITTGKAQLITLGSTLTTGGGLSIIGGSYAHGAETGSLVNLAFTDATTAAVTSTSNGMLITPTISAASGAATRTINGLSVNPAFTNCAAGTCAVNGINVASVTDGTGFTGTGINIGTGWDAGFNIQSGGNLIKATGTNVFQVQDTNGLSIANVNSYNIANLVSNPSFENGINGWAAKGSITTFAYDNTAANSQFGSATLKVVTTAATTVGAQYSIPLKASTQYSFNLYAKVAASSVTAILGRQENGSDVETSCVGFTITTAWTQFTCTFTTGATINGATNIYLRQTASSVNTIYVDGVTLVQASSGLTFDAGGSNINVQSQNSNITFNNTNTGELQPWQQSANALTANREAAGTITQNGFVYVVGGFDGTNRQNTVLYAKMNSDGSTGAWAATTAVTNNAVAQNRQYPAVTVANGYMYVIGGFDGTQANSTVFYSKLNNDGTTGVWNCQGAVTAAGCGATSLPMNGNGLPAAKVAPSVVVSNGFIYVLGGCTENGATCTTPSTTNYYAKLQADGTTGPWTSTGALSSARGMGSALFANGNVYFLGGRNTTGVTTVDKSVVAGDGSLAAFSTTGMTALPTNRQEHSSVIANGYMYVIGGADGAASSVRQTTVYYSKLNADGTNGIWQTNSNALPSIRAAHSTAIANGYVYVIGGCNNTTAGACGTSQTSNVYYSSTARILLAGTLDLVGLTSQNLGDFGGAGAITAGNIRGIGDLKIDGYADFNNGISVDSAINLNGISSTAGQNIFNINNLNSNSIFNIRHMSTNFGSLVTGGAFVQKNSYWGEEFNVGHTTNCTTTAALSAGTINAFARGDYGGNANSTVACASTATTTVNGGELNVADVVGTAVVANNQCLVSSQNAANGVERISAVIVTAVAGSKAACAENLAFNTTTSNKIFTTTNLPVIIMKAKMQAFSASATGSVFVLGASTRDQPGTDGTGASLPNTGIFFTNCSGYTAGTGAPTGCGGTTWYGMVASGGNLVGSAQTCTGTVTTSNYSYMRIEVRGTSDIHFFVDVNTSDGINETECGTGVASASSTAAMTPWMEVKAIANAVLTNTLDIDYYRSWQDDNVETTSAPSDQTTPLTLNSGPEEQTSFDARTILAKFLTMTDEEVATAETQRIDTGVLTASSQVVTPKLTANGLHIDSISATGDIISLLSDVSFIGRPYFNSDTAGFAQLKEGDRKVTIKFDKEYLEQPIVNIGIIFNVGSSQAQADPETAKRLQAKQEQAAQNLFDAGVQYVVINSNRKEFTILLNKAAPKDITFSWIALAVKNVKIALPQDNENEMEDSGEVAGAATSSDDNSPASEESSVAPPEESSENSPTDSESNNPPADSPSVNPSPTNSPPPETSN